MANLVSDTFRTGNPALTAKTFDLDAAAGESAMTLNGTVFKTGLLLAVTAAAATFTWKQFLLGGPAATTPWMLGGVVGGLIVALVTVYWKQAAPFTAPLYGALEGLALGGISAAFELRFPGIAVEAIGLTFGTLGALLLAYTSGLIKPSENLKLGIVAATGAVALLYLCEMFLGFFKVAVPYIHQSGPIGIAFSAVVVVIAAFNLVLDFDFIEEGVRSRSPKYMEWYAA
ncbi:MAG: Bax inhibitor-1/YccA family protein, partial [bacterium]